MVGLRRRGLLLAATGLLANGCGGGDPAPSGRRPRRTPTPDDAEAQADVAVLNALLDLEHRFAAVYQAAAGRARGASRDLLGRLLAHEREHARLLGAAVRDLGGVPSAPHARYDLSGLDGPGGVLAEARRIEETAVAAHLDALAALRGAGTRRLAAGIVAVEAEHLAAVRAASGRPAAPAAFVTGRQRP